jgi:CubicO group peptidase (beta-lactamase class C family)
VLQVAASAADLNRATPEQVGLSSKRLQRLASAMQAEIDQGRKAGIAVLIARKNKIVYEKAFGFADVESKLPLRSDSYFRVYSMTKPIISVALLMLYEEGNFQLTDPLEKYIPAMKDVKVYAGDDADGSMILEAPKRKITIQDVFRHTAGFGYGLLPDESPKNPIDKAYQDAGVDYGMVDSPRELAEDKLPKLPLLYHPGERWVYSFAHDVQAYLVEHFSGMPVDRFLSKRIFKPLGMHDSFYGDPEGCGDRCTTVYDLDDQGSLKAIDRPLGFSHARFSEHPFGGAGLTMTLMDYAKFSQMLLNGGEFNGTRILGRKTVELMTTNHLPPEMETSFAGAGYGLGVGVVTNLAEAGKLGSIGQYFWGGAATTWVIIDPKEEMVALIFAQHIFDLDFLSKSQTLVYQAIVD